MNATAPSPWQRPSARAASRESETESTVPILCHFGEFAKQKGIAEVSAATALVEEFAGLLDEPRVGAPRKITDQQIEDVITKTLESMPANSTHWSTRLMAQEAGLTQNAIVRIWRAFGLQPHRVENFKFSKDPQFVEKVRDIVGLYLNPPDRAIVLCRVPAMAAAAHLAL
jgi:hypothetical protein